MPCLLPKKELSHTILLHPSYFGPRMTEFLEKKLYADVEGMCRRLAIQLTNTIAMLYLDSVMLISYQAHALENLVTLSR